VPFLKNIFFSIKIIDLKIISQQTGEIWKGFWSGRLCGVKFSDKPSRITQGLAEHIAVAFVKQTPHVGL